MNVGTVCMLNAVCWWQCVGEMTKTVDAALAAVSSVDHKKVVVDLDGFKDLEQRMENMDRVYTQCFELKVTNLSMKGSRLSLEWELEDEDEAELFQSVCNGLRVKVGIVTKGDDAGDDEKQMEQPGTIRWIEEIWSAGQQHVIEKRDAEILKAVKDADTLVVQVVALDDKDEMIQTKSQYFQCTKDGIAFVGYVQWKQVSAMSREEEDTAMNTACTASYEGSRAATYKELFDRVIKGLVKPNGDNFVLFHSGNDDLWKGSSHTIGKREYDRKGASPSNYPWSSNSFVDCNNANRQTVAVMDSFVCKPLK